MVAVWIMITHTQIGDTNRHTGMVRNGGGRQCHELNLVTNELRNTLAMTGRYVT